MDISFEACFIFGLCCQRIFECSLANNSKSENLEIIISIQIAKFDISTFLFDTGLKLLLTKYSWESPYTILSLIHTHTN